LEAPLTFEEQEMTNFMGFSTFKYKNKPLEERNAFDKDVDEGQDRGGGRGSGAWQSPASTLCAWLESHNGSCLI